jgi:hypothetical protein
MQLPFINIFIEVQVKQEEPEEVLQVRQLPWQDLQI